MGYLTISLFNLPTLLEHCRKQDSFIKGTILLKVINALTILMNKEHTIYVHHHFTIILVIFTK